MEEKKHTKKTNADSEMNLSLLKTERANNKERNETETIGQTCLKSLARSPPWPSSHHGATSHSRARNFYERLLEAFHIVTLEDKHLSEVSKALSKKEFFLCVCARVRGGHAMV